MTTNDSGLCSHSHFSLRYPHCLHAFILNEKNLIDCYKLTLETERTTVLLSGNTCIEHHTTCITYITSVTIITANFDFYCN